MRDNFHLEAINYSFTLKQSLLKSFFSSLAKLLLALERNKKIVKWNLGNENFWVALHRMHLNGMTCNVIRIRRS